MSDAILELLLHLEQKARACAYPENSWEGYALLLRYWQSLAQRMPDLSELCQYDESMLDHIFGTELEHLANLVSEIFPAGGFEELSMYLKTAAS